MNILILATLIFLGFFIQTVSGFGSNLIILSIGILFFDFYDILPVVLIFNIIMCSYILIKYYKYLDIKFILKHIISFMGTGFIIGLFIANHIKDLSININKLLSILILSLSLFELSLLIRKKNIQIKNKTFGNLWIFISGIIHAIFATGGPFLVYGISHLNIDKTKFRISLMFIWLVFNSILLHSSSFNLEHIKLSLYLIFILPLSIWLGQYVHYKISLERFHILIRIILIISSIIVIIK
ncbi:MAG: hypothetical protein KatS3mg129_1736 [Leptospiraceae bacterium]|nr:MAG: hypothetical protein KatS3mg129_1736 [Leptospiraceae bacterium]